MNIKVFTSSKVKKNVVNVGNFTRLKVKTLIVEISKISNLINRCMYYLAILVKCSL